MLSLLKQLHPSSSSSLRNGMPLMSCVFPDGFWGGNTEVSGHGWMTKSFISTRQSEEGVSLSSAY